MNKLIIGNQGYDFTTANIEELKNSFSKFPNEELLYVLPNYTLLKETREELLNKVNAIPAGNIVTFDDIAKRFADKDVKYLCREDIPVVVKMALNKLPTDTIKEFFQVKETNGFFEEISNFIQNFKASGATLETFKSLIGDNPELLEIYKVFNEYESILSIKNLGDPEDLYNNATKNLNELEKISVTKIIIYSFIEFRKQELDLINAFRKKSVEIIVQYPFNMQKNSSQKDKLIEDFEKIGFEVKNIDPKFNSLNEKLGYYGLCEKDITFENKTTVISASSKYYELKKVFNELKKRSSETSFEDMSIVITDSYEELAKNIAIEENIPISIMNEVSGKDLPLVRSAINFLELLLMEERTNLITFIKDGHFNNYESDNYLDLEWEFRQIEYRGLKSIKQNGMEEVSRFINGLIQLKEKIFSNPSSELKLYIESLKLKNQIIRNYSEHKNTHIFKQSIKSIDIITKSIDSVIEFSNMIEMDVKTFLELVLKKLKNSSYYESSNNNGIKISKMINAVGIKSKVKAICGLDLSFPGRIRNTYLFSNKFENILNKLEIVKNDNYGNFENEKIKFFNNISNTDEAIFSYSYSNPEIKSECSVLLSDVIKKTDPNYIIFIESQGFINKNADSLNTIRERTVGDLYNNPNDEIHANYLTANKAETLVRITRDNYFRFSDSQTTEHKKFRGQIFDSKNINLINDEANELTYSASMLNSYISCPFKFYMRYISNIENVQRDYEDEYAIDRGIFYHEVLREFYSENPNFMEYSEETIEKYLSNYINNMLTKLNLTESETKISSSIYLAILKKFVLQEIEFRQSFKKEFFPAEFEKRCYIEVDSMKIKGFVDRIDKSDDGDFLIIDYKAKYAPTIKNVETLKDIQLPLYAYLVGKQKNVGALYFVIEDSKMVTPYLFNEVYKFGRKAERLDTPEKLEVLFDNLEILLRDINKSIKNGVFLINPIDKNVCSYCEYINICRVEEYKNEV